MNHIVIKSVSEMSEIREDILGDYLLRLEEVYHCEFSFFWVENSSDFGFNIRYSGLADGIEEEIGRTVQRLDLETIKFDVLSESRGNSLFAIKFIMQHH